MNARFGRYILWRRLLRRGPCRRAIAALLLGMMTIAAAGVPLPGGLLLADTGELFPCMGHGCGCRTAEQCRRACCCFTAAHRAGWYLDRGLPVPAECQAAADDHARQAPTGCCSQLREKACCQESSQRSDRNILVLRALECRGHASLLAALAPGLAPVLLEVTQRFPESCELVGLNDEDCISRGLSPDPRPPCAA